MKERPDDFYKYLITTDKKMFPVSGHVFSSKNCTSGPNMVKGLQSTGALSLRSFQQKFMFGQLCVGLEMYLGPTS